MTLNASTHRQSGLTSSRREQVLTSPSSAPTPRLRRASGHGADYRFDGGFDGAPVSCTFGLQADKFEIADDPSGDVSGSVVMALSGEAISAGEPRAAALVDQEEDDAEELDDEDDELDEDDEEDLEDEDEDDDLDEEDDDEDGIIDDEDDDDLDDEEEEEE